MELGKDNLLINTMGKIVAPFRDKHLLCGMTLLELFACYEISSNERMNKPTHPKDVAAALRISKPAVSKLLNAMEGKGLILREHRAENRKTIYLSLTDKAVSLMDEQKATASVVTKRVFAEMGTEKAKEMIALVDLFYDSYKKVEASMWAD